MLSKGTCFGKKFVIKMATSLCNILKPIHNDNLIHRDISPNNVMYSQIEDKFYLIDFGNSRLNKINTPKDTVFAGTPIFMAPEQGGVGTQSDNRTDIYAIGMLMKFMLTKNTTDKKSKIRGRLGKIIKKCTQSEIASRYKNVDKLKFKLSMIKVDDFLFPFKIYLYILIGVIFILPTIITVFFDLNNMIHMYTDIRRYNLVNPIQNLPAMSAATVSKSIYATLSPTEILTGQEKYLILTQRKAPPILCFIHKFTRLKVIMTKPPPSFLII